MANTLSVMTNVLRNVVSKQRIRYKEGGYNLDLAYICDNIIAMGYPADKIESFYRNRLEDVYRFLEDYHHDHYKIYNLCLERSYDINKFHKRVAVFPFEDHNPPTIELIQQFCDDVDSWLKRDRNNVAAVHCKAGKGRTGTMICCYLLYSGQQCTAEDALAFYDEKRTKDRKGVTIPSQRRYVQYFSILVRNGFSYKPLTLKLCEIRFGETIHLQNQGIVNCSISSIQHVSSSIRSLCNISMDFRKTSFVDLSGSDVLVTGDIRVEITHKTSRKSFLHFWFNTYFVEGAEPAEKDSKIVYTLNKWEIDDVHKDKDHKFFSEDFKVFLTFDRSNFEVLDNPKESNISETYRNLENNCKLLRNDLCAEGITNGRLVGEENKNDAEIKTLLGTVESGSKKLTEHCQPHHLTTVNNSFIGKGMHNEFHIKESIINTSDSRHLKCSHGYHIDELSDKIQKITICDDDVLRKSNSKMPQLQLIRNSSHISRVYKTNSSSVGDANFEEDWESGESTYL